MHPHLAIAISVIALVAAGCGGAATATPTATPVATPTAAPATATPSISATPTPAPTPTQKPDPTALQGPLGAGRQIHTATVLADGRVLVAGGFDFGDLPLGSATLYDPATNRFIPTGSLAVARGFHTSTLLRDGRVLITGGGPAAWIFPGPYLASAELFDTGTGSFSPTGAMTITRENHTATLLRDGRVLIVGGNDDGDHAVASAELYDPKTGKFSPTGSMATARGYHTATLLADGRVLVAGGDPSNNNFHSLISSAEIYDPKTGTFTGTGSIAPARAFDAATLLADGRVLVTGGSDGFGDLASAEIYNPKPGTFTTTGSMATPRTYTTATLLADGRVLVAGGGGDYANRQFLASAEIFDPKAGTWIATGSMVEARTWGAAVPLKDGRVLVTGGYGDLAPLASAELYDPKSGTFSPAGGG
jgi:WD40 repeat protein